MRRWVSENTRDIEEDLCIVCFTIGLFFLSNIVENSGNMTEDDWKWHMYDTVKVSYFVLYL